MPETLAEFTARLRGAGRDPDALLAGLSRQRVDDLVGEQVQRSGLCRTVSFRATEAAAAGDNAEGDGLTIEGYGAVFNSATEINSWEGHFQEIIDPGAFKKSLREQTPIMQFDHGYHPLLGGLPLGRWTDVHEDDHGLYTLGRMYSGWLFEPFAEAIRDTEGGVTGMSFRFSVVREKWQDADGKEVKEDELFELLYYGSGDRGPITRHLREVKVAEVGPVVWPAYKDTTVGARSADGQTLVIDLAALRSNPRDGAFALAAMEAELSRATEPTPAANDPRARWQPVGVAALARMAREAHAERERARVAPDAHRGVVHTDPVATPPSAPVKATPTEPQPTGTPAAEHPERTAPAPLGTDQEPAGSHSPSSQPTATARPVNPAERKRNLVAEYREVLDRTLALPRPTT